METLRSTKIIYHTIARLLQFDHKEKPELWVFTDMLNVAGAQAFANERNKTLEETPGDFVSPKSPYFVVKVTREEKVKRVDDSPEGHHRGTGNSPVAASD